MQMKQLFIGYARNSLVNPNRNTHTHTRTHISCIYHRRSIIWANQNIAAMRQPWISKLVEYGKQNGYKQLMLSNFVCITSSPLNKQLYSDSCRTKLQCHVKAQIRQQTYITRQGPIYTTDHKSSLSCVDWWNSGFKSITTLKLNRNLWCYVKQVRK
jgi:hypothetical protein